MLTEFNGDMSLLDYALAMAENPMPVETRQEFGDAMHDQYGWAFTDDEKKSIAAMVDDMGGYENLPED